MKKKEIILKADARLLDHVKNLIQRFRDLIQGQGYKKTRLDLLERVFSKRKKKKDERFESDQIILISFEDWKDYDEIIEVMGSEDLFPPDLERFLLLGRQRSELRMQGPIITFNPVFAKGDDILVPSFNKTSGDLPDLWLLKEPWSNRCRFATLKLS